MRGFWPRAEPDMIYISVRPFRLCCGELTIGGQCERRETITVNQVGVVMVWTRLLIMSGIKRQIQDILKVQLPGLDGLNVKYEEVKNASQVLGYNYKWKGLH